MSTKHNTEILVPFIGAFSSGKSSLINALLGDNLLSTDITPETALPIELRVGEAARFHACWPDGRQAPIEESQFRAADFSALAGEDGWIHAHLPALKPWPNLVLVDLPGWSSGQSEHERRLDAYLAHLARTHLDKNTLYVVAVSADEGTLRDNVRERLQALDMGQSPYLLVLTKTDKRNADDLEQISEHLRETVAAAIGKAPQQVVLSSARKKEIEGLRQVIKGLQKAQHEKQPAVDTAKLAKAIDLHIERITEASRERRDVAIYVFDDVWDEFADTMLDEYFDYTPYEWTKSRGDALVAALERNYMKFLEQNVERHFPMPGGELLESLKKLNLSSPDVSDINDTGATLSRRTKKHVSLAIEKSKPGLFSSDDPEAVAERVRSRLRDMRSEFRGDVIDCAYTSLSAWLDTQRDGWQRLRGLISV